ncbi:unnamed protein product [Mytilus coruscus]|uniref:Endonuclease/exonuclease/phosphatase domain-containing protein n=1 Tax=Mytilus coruscus TaxID=42192 RepID=A0A6J8CGN0_MYTCO|nr:unnamed protein product [Mytilus coruscus]
MADLVNKDKQSKVDKFINTTPKSSAKRDQPASSPDLSSPSSQQVEKQAKLKEFETSQSHDNNDNHNHNHSPHAEHILAKSIENGTVFKLSEVVCATLNNQAFINTIIPMITEKIMDQVKPKIIEIVDDRIQPYIDTITQNKDALILQEAELKKKRRNKIPRIPKIQARQDINVTDLDISLLGFETPVRKDRNANGGGITMCYKSFINIIRRVDLKHDQVESMWFELKTRLRSILININYRSERQSSVYFWEYYDMMLKRALDENSSIICLGDLNKKFMSVIPSNTRDIIFINGLINIIDKPTHFDTRSGNTSLLDPILVTDSTPVVDKDTIPIDRGISDHDGTYVTIDCGFTSSRTYKRTIWDYKNGDFDLMNQKVLGTD